MKHLINKLRAAIRLTAAIFFWIHALFLHLVPSLPISRVGKALGLNFPETSIMLAIALLTVLASYDFGRFAVDLAYIYFFPFIALYYMVRTVVLIATRTYRLLYPQEGVAASPPVQDLQKPSPAAAPPTEDRKNWLKNIFFNISRPVRQFALLWCLLLLFSSRHWLLIAALAIVLLQLTFTVSRVIGLAVISIRWLARLENLLKQRVGEMLGVVATISAEEQQPTQELRNLVSRVVGVRAGVQLARNRKQITFAVVFISVSAFLIFYLYLAILFSFAYFGIAKVQSVKYSWSEAFVTSMFIPFAYTDLPNNFWLKLVGGLQGTLAVALSIGAVLGYFQRKINSLYALADSLNSQFDQPELREKLEVLQRKWNIAQVPSPKQN